MDVCRKHDIISENNKSKWLIKKDCAITSVKEIECFLHNLNKLFKFGHLYKFLK